MTNSLWAVIAVCGLAGAATVGVTLKRTHRPSIATEDYGKEDRHHTPAHGGLGRQLHQTVRRGGEGLGRDTNDDKSEGEEPVAGHKRG